MESTSLGNDWDKEHHYDTGNGRQQERHPHVDLDMQEVPNVPKMLAVQKEIQSQSNIADQPRADAESATQTLLLRKQPMP